MKTSYSKGLERLNALYKTLKMFYKKEKSEIIGGGINSALADYNYFQPRAMYLRYISRLRNETSFEISFSDGFAISLYKSRFGFDVFKSVKLVYKGEIISLMDLDNNIPLSYRIVFHKIFKILVKIFKANLKHEEMKSNKKVNDVRDGFYKSLTKI